MAIINILRQPYHCGNKAAGRVAERRGSKVIDKFVINDKTKALHCNFSNELQHLARGKAPVFFKHFFIHPRVHKVLSQAIFFEKASNDNVVILGRGGQYVIDMPHILNVRMVSSPQAMQANPQQRENISPDAAKDLLKKETTGGKTLSRMCSAGKLETPIPRTGFSIMKNRILTQLLSRLRTLQPTQTMLPPLQKQIKASLTVFRSKNGGGNYQKRTPWCGASWCCL
ncbi:MAG: cytidylate kinase family protein [Desulfobacter sp.]